MKKIILYLMSLLLLLNVLLAGQPQNELIIKYKDNSEELPIVLPPGSDIESIKPLISEKNLYKIEMDSKTNISELIEEYSKLDEVDFVETNKLYRAFSVTPNDTYFSYQWAINHTHINSSWSLSTGNSSIVIAIIDTGVDWHHPDLAGNIWNNSDEIPANNEDDDGNGYTDDIRGWDFVNLSSSSFCFSGEDCVGEDNDPMDFHGHGTHCSGIAAAVTNNSEGISGACWNCKIMPLKAGYVDDTGSAVLSVDDIVEAIYYAANNNATIISMSFGGESSSSLETALDYARSKGVILVAAAGNNNSDTINYPAGYSTVISVAATNINDEKASYSSYGNWIDISAPGGDSPLNPNGILSTYYNYSTSSSTYAWSSGTSMATPLVAGAIGLIISSTGNTNQTDILNALKSTGKDVNFSGYNIPLINVYDAIIYLDDSSPIVNLISPSNNTSTSNRNQIFYCNASDLSLKNITLKIWYENASLYYNESKNIFGKEQEVNFSLNNIPLGDYYWNCYSYDESGNLGFAQNYSLKIYGVDSILISPSNLHYTNSDLTNFTCNSTTDGITSLVNVTFFLWNSSGNLIYNETKNISGIINQSLFTLNFTNLSLSEGNYSWNCLSYDNESDNSFSEENYSITYDLTKPLINIISPRNLSWSNALKFNVSITDLTPADSCFAYFNNSNLSMTKINSTFFYYLNQTINESSSTNFYNVSFYCNDSAGNMNISEVVLFGVDKTPPNLMIISPQDSYSTTTSGTADIQFKFNTSDERNISYCKLIITGSQNKNSTIYNPNLTNTIVESLSPGNYNWKIMCFDGAENLNESSIRTLTINQYTPVLGHGSSSSSSSSGIVSSSGGAASFKKIYLVNQVTLEKGFSKKLKKSDEVRFFVGGISHKFLLSEIYKTKVNIKIFSNVYDFNLSIGDFIKLNLSSPCFYDLYIKLNNISNSEADITIKKINETIIQLVKEGQTNESRNNTFNTLNSQKFPNYLSTHYLIILFLFVLLIIFFITLLKPKKKSKKKKKPKKRKSKDKKTKRTN